MFTVTKESEVKLVESLGALAEERDNWRAVIFHLSEMQEDAKSEYQVKISVNLVLDLLREFDGGVFVLSTGSMVVMCRQLPSPLLNKLIFQLRYLYMDDPLAYGLDGSENPDFCTIYDLSERWDDFYEECNRRMMLVARKRPAGAAPARPAAAKPSEPAANPQMSAAPVRPSEPEMRMIDRTGKAVRDDAFSASRLARIETDLVNADLSRAIRRQPICAAVPGTAVRPVFEELYIHMPHLKQLLRADVDFFSNQWLFRYLTQILDARMLWMLKHYASRFLQSPISINIHVETLLSDAFREFDAAVKPEVRVATVLEVPIVDVFSDIMTFLHAREQVQRLGYRICIDGLNTTSFLQIDRARLGADLIKLQWNADRESDLNSPENRKLVEAVKACGPNRVILCRCDSKYAIQYGQAMGLSLFQGRYVDLLLNPSAKIAN